MTITLDYAAICGRRGIGHLYEGHQYLHLHRPVPESQLATLLIPPVQGTIGLDPDLGPPSAERTTHRLARLCVQHSPVD